ncbi:MAG: CBS domain-containing protein [Candidatus Competibacteraceae bacterium]|nr:CBS domain-containing protein [Candidatus Competibacteraceae bacterium]MBK7982954.1 CBS domain-containing protein [Candidatus Competibacteraceae bacterium]MBK8898494.1 CBS domain-containing protein [Candidatus Competibacteraceae bacterium]MBK8962303.1 CBS domain-containing protein [Candidatus Competibacteraceae bacterium]MBK9951522.1 CBS domain-containing protein [Candidatus Competibacteraceae bacterium]
MYVDRIMSRDVLQVAEDARVTQLAALMRDRHIRHLPVARDGRLVGLVTSHDLERVAPSPVTTLSVGEANYLLGKLTAAKVMRAQVVTCAPDTLVEEAARVLREKKIGCLPVVEPSGRLVGILTHEDVLDFFLDITGCLAEGTTRIAAHLPDAIGQLGRFLTAINDAGGYIATVVSPVHPDQTGLRIVVVRYRAADPRLLNQRLRDLGYDLLTETWPSPSAGA